MMEVANVDVFLLMLMLQTGIVLSKPGKCTI